MISQNTSADNSTQVVIQSELNSDKKVPVYRKYLWVFFLLFPFAMQKVDLTNLGGKSPYVLPITAQLEFESKAIKLEVARTPQAIGRGLTYRDNLDSDRGMLYKVSNTYFTGKGMKFPTTLVFLSNDKVVDTQNVEPCSDGENKCLEYRTNVAYDEVLETNKGVSAKLGINVGSKVKIEYLPY